jgi:hypothetical protein
MIELYSYKGAYPYPLPEDMSNYLLEDFVLAPSKPDLLIDEFLDWDGSNWIVRKANASETSIKGQEVRDFRNLLLDKSDIDIIQSYEKSLTGQSVDATSLIIYRQQLRDITTQPGFPWEIVWPEKP